MALFVLMGKPGSAIESDAEGSIDDWVALPVGPPYVLTRYCSLEDFSSILSWQEKMLHVESRELAGLQAESRRPRGTVTREAN